MSKRCYVGLGSRAFEDLAKEVPRVAQFDKEHLFGTQTAIFYYPGQKKEPSLWCIMWYRRICSLISPRCIDAWSRGSRKSRSLAVPQLNQAPWFLDITRFWFYASTGWFFFLSRVVAAARAAALSGHVQPYGRSYFCLLNIIFGCVSTEFSIQFSARSFLNRIEYSVC